ncbi:cytochrome c3 family protein [Chloroflexota bacterium]
MEKSRLGCFSVSGLLAFVLTLVLVGAAYATRGGTIFSPGELSAGGGDEVLNGVVSHNEIGPDCAACHTPPWSGDGMSRRCLVCHDYVFDEFVTPSGRHGAFVPADPRINCLDCHTEHLGANTNISYFSEQYAFQHDTVGFSLTAHRENSGEGALVCEDCHQGQYSDFKVTVCRDCHQERDSEGMARHLMVFDTDCLACHDGLETYGANFDHNAMPFPLIGEHARLECADCHANAENIEILKSVPQNCAACHLEEDIHLGGMGEHCETCHTPVGWDQVSFNHATIGFPLIGGHLDLECEQCHLAGTYQTLSAACANCHLEDDPHDRLYGEMCENCHTVEGWEFISFDHEMGGAVDCQNCHLADQPVGHYPGQCSVCHSTDAWEPASIDHELAQAVDCQGCHLADKPELHFTSQCSLCHSTTAWKPASFNHQAAGTLDCQGCHLGVRPAGHYVGQCSFCHSTTAWKPASFRHTFPIKHEGANSRCELCHPGGNYFTYTCGGCHEHNLSAMRKEHNEVGGYSENCIACHPDGREHDD